MCCVTAGCDVASPELFSTATSVPRQAGGLVKPVSAGMLAWIHSILHLVDSNITNLSDCRPHPPLSDAFSCDFWVNASCSWTSLCCFCRQKQTRMRCSHQKATAAACPPGQRARRCSASAGQLPAQGCAPPGQRQADRRLPAPEAAAAGRDHAPGLGGGRLPVQGPALEATASALRQVSLHALRSLPETAARVHLVPGLGHG